VNETTERILAVITKGDDIWDRGSKKEPIDPPRLRLSTIQYRYDGLREALFWREITLPLYRRIMSRVKSSFERISPEWVAEHIGWDDELESYLFESCGQNDCTALDLSYRVSEFVDGITPGIWWSDKWLYEEISEEMVLQFVMPKMIPPKGGMQSLF
jgi:hypothetical protein